MPWFARGFCTPGIAMTLWSVFHEHHQQQGSESPRVSNRPTSFPGNLCCCTGYRPIPDVISACLICCLPRVWIMAPVVVALQGLRLTMQG